MKKNILKFAFGSSLTLPLIALSCSNVEKVDNESNLYYEIIEKKDIDPQTKSEITIKEAIITGVKLLIKKDGNLVDNDGDLIIPEKIGQYNVASIQKNAFNGSKFSTIKLGKNITEIGIDAFSNMPNLVSANLSESNLLILPAKTFANNPNLKLVELSERIALVGENAFQNATNASLVINFNNKMIDENNNSAPLLDIAENAFSSLSVGSKIVFKNIDQISYETKNSNNNWKLNTKAIVEFKNN